MKFIRIFFPLAVLALLISGTACGQPLNKKKGFTLQDTLRGSNTPERAWWNVTKYDLWVKPDYASKTIQGRNRMSFNFTGKPANGKMQIDLQEPMQLDSVFYLGKKLSSPERVGNVYYVDLGSSSFKEKAGQAKPGKEFELTMYFSGKPREARRPPWDGGWIWSRDAKGRPWMSVACQGLGASVWYPCKDYQADEPDNGALISVQVPDTLVAVANGRISAEKDMIDGTTMYTWKVTAPINNYNIVPYIGKYVHIGDTYKGEKGRLTLDYWVLDYSKAKADTHFARDVKRMLQAFEYWFGPYPFYEDGYKLVESPHLGMEHQSAVAYGNRYMDGYLGRDLSGSGWGLKWDYIIVHESGHEWFANNITTNDIADMWVHEGFTMYSEPLFIEYFYGKEAADAYVQGIRRNISNDIPVIGVYGVNQEGSGDMYNKGANMLHTIRQVIHNDSLFRSILRGLNKDFYHQTVDSRDVEQYFSAHAGIDLSKIFDQYLRTVNIPVLEYKQEGQKITYRWTQVVDSFAMPVVLGDTDKGFWLYPTTEWKTSTLPEGTSIDNLNKNFYIRTRKAE